MTTTPTIDADVYPVVVGIVSARIRGAQNDAAALFMAYVGDTMDQGRPSEEAWRQLASAAMVLLADQTLDIARMRGQTAANAVLDLAGAANQRHGSAST